MNKLYLLLWVMVVAIAASLPVATSAATVEYRGVYYDLTKTSDSEGEAQVVAPTTGAYSGAITITPQFGYSSVKYTVTSIGKGAFLYATGLTSVWIPYTVKSINDYAFYGCYNLTKVEIGRTDGAGNPNLVEIGNTAFWGCQSLASFTYSNASFTKRIKKIGASAFMGCKSLKEFPFSDSTATIGAAAFKNTGLTSIKVGRVQGGVTYINKGAFSDCKSLTTVIFLSNVVVGNNGFSNCTSLSKTRAYGLASFREVGDSAFFNCTALEYVYNTLDPTLNIGSKSFYGCKNLKSVTIGINAKSICDSAFYNCKSLKSIDLNNVVSLGKGAFSGSGLIRVKLPSNLQTLSEGCFSNCTQLINVNLSNVKTIGKSAFYYTQLYSVKLPTTLRAIYDNAFGKCYNLYEVYCPVSTPPTLMYAFSDYDIVKHTTLYVPKNTENLYQAANGWNEFGRIVGADLSGVDDAKTDKVTVKANNGAIEVTGAADGAPVAVYRINGSLVSSGTSGQAIDVPAGIYIVKVGSQAFKTVVR